MKITNYKYIMCAALVLLTACSGEESVLQQPDPVNPETPSFTVGEADNAIVLMAGISEGGKGVQTRAGEVIYKAFNGATQLRLRVDGTWLGHTPSTGISQNTTATTAASATIDSDNDASGDNGSHVNDTHTLDYVADSGDKKLYWDDYGTADPANMSLKVNDEEKHVGNGRDKGLTIYGVAVDGKSTLPVPATSDTRTDLRLSNDALNWEGIHWNVGTPESGTINQTSGWSDYDLLTSNNVTAEDGADGTYKFNDRASGKLLKFTHAMTKITVNLTAGEGFPDYSSSDATAAKFENNPSVTLKDFNYMGKVDVINKTSTAKKAGYTDVGSGETAAKANVAMNLTNGGASSNTAKFEALVFPGNTFSATIGEAPGNVLTSSDVILELNADGNIYKVTAAQLVKKINNATTTGTYNATLEQGKNYILNITVNKTEVKVNATVVNWSDVVAAEEAPVINISTPYISSGNVAPISFTYFSFYRSASDPTNSEENKLSGYSSTDESLEENGFYKPEGVPSGSLSNTTAKWDFGTGKTLYWPSHNTHYHFRGVWPNTVTTANSGYSGGEYDWAAPRLRDVSNDDPTQVIDIKNVAYSSGSFPSDLLIGMPVFTEGDDGNLYCKNENHSHIDQSKYGICATEGLITLNFKYIMSQVEVILSTSSSTSTDYVNIGENTIVEIVNVANDGYVKLGDREVVPATAPSSSRTNFYVLGKVAGSDNDLKRCSAIVPQKFQYVEGATTNTRFKITVTNTDGTQDIYYADIAPILKSGSPTAKIAPNGWESGVHYVYNLKLTKTEVKLTATITDWVTVTGGTTIVM